MLRKLKAIENWTLLWCYAACRNYHYYLRNNPEERTFHNLRDGSLKSRYREPYKTLEYILSKMTTRQNALAEYCSYNISHPRTYLCTFQPWVSRSGAIISRSLRTVGRGENLSTSCVASWVQTCALHSCRTDSSYPRDRRFRAWAELLFSAG